MVQRKAHNNSVFAFFCVKTKKEVNILDFYMKLPRNRKEFGLFLFIVSVLSVNIIAPLISGFEMGFNFETWKHTLKVLPFIWIVVVLLVLLIHTPASKVTNFFISKEDSFNSHILNVKSHTGIVGNSLADKIAKDVSICLEKFEQIRDINKLI